MTSNQDETLDKAKVPVVKVYAATVTSNLYAARLTPEELVAHHLDKANDHLIRVLEVLQNETLDKEKVAVVKVYATTGQDLTRLSIETWTE